MWKKRFGLSWRHLVCGLSPNAMPWCVRPARSAMFVRHEKLIVSATQPGLSDPLVGLKMGNFFGLAGYGPLVMLLMTCATAYEALQTGVRYQRLTYLYG